MKFGRSSEPSNEASPGVARMQAAFMPAIYAERTDAFDNEVHDFDHFLAVGLSANISPSVYFDPDFYARQLDPSPSAPLLEHFVTVGAAAGLDPHPLVDTNLVIEQSDLRDPGDLLGFLASPESRQVRLHPLFWSGFYLESNPSIADRIGHPLHHYLNVGHRRRRAPNPFFSHDYCESVLEETDGATVAMLLHWLEVGVPAEVVPTPLFDAAHYRKEAGLAGSDVTAYLHFLRIGLWKDLSPHPLVDPDWYRTQYPDVPPSEPAVLHYLREEHRREHRPGPQFDPAAMQRIVVHDDHPYGGRILERYLAGGVTAVHVSPPLELSDALRAQIDDASILLPRATAPYQRALAANAPIRQNFNTHDTRKTGALRILEAGSPAVGGAIAIVEGDDERTLVKVEMLSSRARSAGIPWHVMNVAAIFDELEPSKDDRDAAIAEWLVRRASAVVIGIGSPTWFSVLKSRGFALRQLMGIGAVASDGPEMNDLPHVIDHLDVLSVDDLHHGDNLMAEFALPQRHRNRLLAVDGNDAGFESIFDRFGSNDGDGPVVRFALR